MDELVAVPSPPEEIEAQKKEVAPAEPLAKKVEPVKHRAVRRRLRVLC